ncbi:MAG: hypothetical protein MUE58_02665 [Chitinophagaceae bacterium]|jgi:hypothetical protein|nr:hypothetical protein [Chitinophagaceae bacterium]
MKEQDPLMKAEQRLAALRKEEQRLQAQIREAGTRIREDAKPTNLLKSTVSGMFRNKSTMAETATAALGIGAGIVAHNIVRKQQRLSLIGKVTGLALGALVTAIASKRKRKA